MMKVAIVGAVNSQWDRVPWKNKAVRIWTVPKISAALPRVDRAYELHPPEVAAKSSALVEKSGAALYTWADMPDFDGPIGGTIAAMIAHAIHEGVDEIALYGSPFAGLGRGDERESAFYWIGYARARGIKFIDGSGLINTQKRYCLEDPPAEKVVEDIDG